MVSPKTKYYVLFTYNYSGCTYNIRIFNHQTKMFYTRYRFWFKTLKLGHVKILMDNRLLDLDPKAKKVPW